MGAGNPPEDLTEISTIKYDKLLPHQFSGHARRVTIGDLKKQRLAIKNMRRAVNGLPPKASYAEI